LAREQLQNIATIKVGHRSLLALTRIPKELKWTNDAQKDRESRGAAGKAFHAEGAAAPSTSE
jgi:hypothetical protein